MWIRGQTRNASKVRTTERLRGEYIDGSDMAPATNLQSDEARHVHECVAGNADNFIIAQAPTDESRLPGE